MTMSSNTHGMIKKTLQGVSHAIEEEYKIEEEDT